MNKYCFLLNFGYAEDSRLGINPFFSEKEFSSAKEAFIDLSKFFLDIYLKANMDEVCSLCCSIKENNKDVYCSLCGNRLHLNEDEFDTEQFLEFLRILSNSTIDSYDEYISDYPNPNWEPLLAFDADEIFNVSEAERCIATAVDHNNYDDRKIDDLFDSLDDNNISFY